MKAAAILSPTPSIATRQEAILLGQRHYYTATPCKYGHIAQRFVSSMECLECLRNRVARKKAGLPALERELLSADEKRRRKSEGDKRYREANKPNKDQLAQRAKNCQRWRDRHPGRANELARKYYARDSGKILARSREYRLASPEKYRARFNEWASKNKAHLKAYRSARYQANRESDLANSKIWKAAHPDQIRERGRQWRKENPLLVKIHKNNRRARIMGNGGRLTNGLAQRLIALQRGKCACCKTNLRKAGFHLDHIEPLAKGGRNDDKNIQLLCPHCNRSKHDKLPHEFMQSRGYLL